MGKYLNIRSSVFMILLIFLLWRSFLMIITFFAVEFIPLQYQDRFLGGGPKNYQILPQLFSWANFDGEHYLSIALFGYKSLEQAFFPFFPFLISFFAKPFSPDFLSSLINSTIIGILISNITFLFSLIFLWKLIRIDFPNRIAFLTIIILILFPTAFYFGALYNESVFLLLSVIAFLSARKGKWFIAGIVGMIASATRVFGFLLLPTLMIEAYQQKANPFKVLWILLIPLGLGLYMWYLYLTVGDPLAFYHFQKLVGEQHQSGIILLPQVYLRYLKMIFSVDRLTPLYQTIWLEFIIGLLFFLLPIYGYFKKIRLSYLFYALAGFLLPSIQGSFSSIPRYVIVLFPSFLILSLIIDKLRVVKYLLLIIFVILLIIETSLFLRGYWIA